MSIQSLPWLFHVEHVDVGQSANYLLGNGGLDFVRRVSLVTLDSVRRMRVDGGTSADPDGRVDAAVPAGTRFVAGFLYRVNSGKSGDRVIAFQNGTTDDFYLGLDSGDLTVVGGGSLLENTGVFMGGGIDRYVEVAVHLDNAGSYEVRVDGVTIASASGVDTTVSGSPADGIRLNMTPTGSSSNVANYAYMYLKEWEDASTPGFYGPLVFHHIAPTADVSTEWDPDSGAENFSRLNEATIDDDTSYVETDVDAEVDEYTAEDAPNDLASIVGVVRYAVATASAGGAPAIELGLKDGVDEEYGSALGLTGAYRTHQSVFETHPDGSAWSEANFASTSMLLRSSLT